MRYALVLGVLWLGNLGVAYGLGSEDRVPASQVEPAAATLQNSAEPGPPARVPANDRRIEFKDYVVPPPREAEPAIRQGPELTLTTEAEPAPEAPVSGESALPESRD